MSIIWSLDSLSTKTRRRAKIRQKQNCIYYGERNRNRSFTIINHSDRAHIPKGHFNINQIEQISKHATMNMQNFKSPTRTKELCREQKFFNDIEQTTESANFCTWRFEFSSISLLNFDLLGQIDWRQRVQFDYELSADISTVHSSSVAITSLISRINLIIINVTSNLLRWKIQYNNKNYPQFLYLKEHNQSQTLIKYFEQMIKLKDKQTSVCFPFRVMIREIVFGQQSVLFFSLSTGYFLEQVIFPSPDHHTLPQ